MTADHFFLTFTGTEPSDSRHTITYEPGQTLAQAVYLSGIAEPPALCSGISLCGRCRLRILSSHIPASLAPAAEDSLVFSEQEIADGWRLGCRHYPLPGLIVEIPGQTRRTAPSQTRTLKPCQALPTAMFEGNTERTPALLAVDLGTTSLAWRLDVQRDGASEILSPMTLNTPLPLGPGSTPMSGCLAHGVMRNPQIGAGSDIVSRLAVGQSPMGKERLQALVNEALRDIVRDAEAKHAVTVTSLCVAANPAITALMLGLETKTLARAPYALPLHGGTWESLPELPPMWIPPQLSPFVGGDISAGYAAIALGHFFPTHEPDGNTCTGHASLPPEYPFLLADLGTNGEFLLAISPREAITASVALGPALEGIGLSCGTEARPGAVTGFSLSPAGLEITLLPGMDSDNASEPVLAGESPASPAAGITGTGYLSLLNLLLKTQAMDREGRFSLERSPLFRRAVSRIRAQGALSAIHGVASNADTLGNTVRSGEKLPLPHGLFLSASDVEEILKVKAAFSLGLHRLLEHAGVASAELARVYVAGSLGDHVDKEALETLGFFPPGLRSRLETVGNSSLTGAVLLLREKGAREALASWATGVRSLDLASDPAFRQHFPEHMRFAW